jgi:restriction system protein
MKSYYRIMLGKKSAHADEAYKGNFIGAGFMKDQNLAQHLAENRRDFNKEFIPIYLENRPGKTKVAAGLACGTLWTIAKEIQIGDVAVCPNGKGIYYAGEVVGDYEYAKDQALPHRRPVRWLSKTIPRDTMSETLQKSTGASGTICDISKHAAELETLLSGILKQNIVTTDETIEDPSVFALEKHLEDFLVENWKNTELGKNYDIFEEEGEIAGQQYPSDTGPIDILAISKNKKELLVVELKRGRVSDVVVGQLQRYMGYVKDELAEANQIVRGVIIAFESDIKIKRALSVAQNIDFYTYKIDFKLEKK